MGGPSPVKSPTDTPIKHPPQNVLSVWRHLWQTRAARLLVNHYEGHAISHEMFAGSTYDEKTAEGPAAP
jgi:hypothetical protein